MIVAMSWHKRREEGHLSGRDAFSSAGSKDSEAGRAASASAVRPLTAATEVPSAAESIEAAGASPCTHLRAEDLLSLLARTYHQVSCCSAPHTAGLSNLFKSQRINLHLLSKRLGRF